MYKEQFGWMSPTPRQSLWMSQSKSPASTRAKSTHAHLRSVDFFDAAHFPTIAFHSRIMEGGHIDDEFRLVGDLTIRGVTREVVLDVSAEGRLTDPWGAERAGFSAHGKIDRTDFGLTWNQALETGGVLVSNEVKISVEVELIRQAKQAAA